MDVQKRKEAARLLKEAEIKDKQDKLDAALVERNIKMGSIMYKGKIGQSLSFFSFSHFPGINNYLDQGAEIFLDETGEPHFPLLLIYEEFHQTDFIQVISGLS